MPALFFLILPGGVPYHSRVSPSSKKLSWRFGPRPMASLPRLQVVLSVYFSWSCKQQQMIEARGTVPPLTQSLVLWRSYRSSDHLSLSEWSDFSSFRSHRLSAWSFGLLASSMETSPWKGWHDTSTPKPHQLEASVDLLSLGL